eukprot:1187554-Prorocentrum_minimum.AAC.4
MTQPLPQPLTSGRLRAPARASYFSLVSRTRVGAGGWRGSAGFTLDDFFDKSYDANVPERKAGTSRLA